MSPKLLIPDIKPTPIKDRTQLGIVDLTLDQHTKVRAVGMVYGLEQEISGDNYKAHLFLDQYNQRLKVMSYSGDDLNGLIDQVEWLHRANGFDKTIVMGQRNTWQVFLRRGFVLEAVLKYYYQGEDCFVMSKFTSQERLYSPSLAEEIALIEQITKENSSQATWPRELPTGYSIRLAQKTDIASLVELYQDIFESYPSPLVHADYLESVFQKNSLFAVCCKNEKIVASASAEIIPSLKAAELTDCATIKTERGLGLMASILDFLESELTKRNYVCAYTMARARSYGMNNVFNRLGYEFMGRLINNCDIYGAYEDMNIWVKKLNSLKSS